MPYSLLELEMQASKSELTEDEFSSMLWHFLVVEKEAKNKKQVKALAKDLNIYPKPANVYLATMQHLTGYDY